jgi:hypothetical protein
MKDFPFSVWLEENSERGRTPLTQNGTGEFRQFSCRPNF